uniref:Uncharacterized protein n=1 Tax=Romanomermis culicivorax TaxID=13658 RepID=A0A915LAE2_ROMCU
MIPAPMIFSKLMELACLVSRKKPCDDSVGFCYLYDNNRLASLFLTSAFIGHILACVFLVLALIFFKRSGREDAGYNDSVGGDENGSTNVKV